MANIDCGILLIVPLLYFSSYEASSSKSTASAPSLSRNGESAGRPTAADAPAPSAEPSSRPAPTPRKLRRILRKHPPKHRICRMTTWLPLRLRRPAAKLRPLQRAAIAPVSRRRCHGQAGISQMPGLPFARTGQERARSEPRRNRSARRPAAYQTTIIRPP